MVPKLPLPPLPPSPPRRPLADGCTTQALSVFREAHIDNPARAAVVILRQDSLGFREGAASAAGVAAVDEDCGQVIILLSENAPAR